ncbi:hypothetical protein ACERII_23575 [Evansella sp. AB-rgal1]|uniref:hypothetical protein n=1 Tax=Evansella sp. AB-rgal1 TaxID=3242696 RepID=UPI00359EB0C9
MKEKSFYFLLVTMLSLFITGCFADPIQEDLEDYVNNGIIPLVPDEEEILGLYESVTGHNYSDDYVLYNTIQFDILPKYQDFIQKLEAIRPSTSEVREIHEIYIKASNEQYSAMVLILDAIDYQDHGLINDANNQLNEARSLFRTFQYELQDLLDEHNLEMEELEELAQH